MTMKKPSKNPAPKSKKPTPKQEGATKEKAVKDAAPATTPIPTATPAPAPKPTPAVPKPRDPRLPAPGALMPRTYKGRTLKVKYLEDGIEVDGKKFDSLSAAARHVTGAASINGFLFFNLTQPKPPREGKPTATPNDAKGKKAAEPKIGNGNDLATLAGQRAALAAVGIAKRGRPITKPRDATAPTKGSAK
jgi:hypothetical protein